MPELEKVSEIILLYGRVQITVYKKQLFDPKKQLFSMSTRIMIWGSKSYSNATRS